MLPKGTTAFLFLKLNQDSRAAFTSMSIVSKLKKTTILCPEDKCWYVLVVRHLRWWRWNRADGSVWLCSECWKTARQMVHGSTGPAGGGLRSSLTGKKWVPESPFQHSDSASVKPSTPFWKRAFELLLTPVRTYTHSCWGKSSRKKGLPS